MVLRQEDQHQNAACPALCLTVVSCFLCLSYYPFRQTLYRPKANLSTAISDNNLSRDNAETKDRRLFEWCVFALWVADEEGQCQGDCRKQQHDIGGVVVRAEEFSAVTEHRRAEGAGDDQN